MQNSKLQTKCLYLFINKATTVEKKRIQALIEESYLLCC